MSVLQVQAQKVGLVLSGGGAKGMAHIGAIRALEENGIPVHYISGTSMGAIIGGLYAAGYSTEEMEQMFFNPQFENWAKGKIDEDHIYYFKRESPNSRWVGFRFNVDSTQFLPTIPVNFVDPVEMDFAFLEIFAGIEAVSKQNFDSLFVPFRCIATDITNSKEVVFRSGLLKDAIRASMTFPFYFRPISINNSLLYDGGMVNNFPTDVLFHDFKPDYIIGIAVARPNEPPSDENLISVLTNMLMNQESYGLKGSPHGIVIHPEVPQLAVTDFSRSRELIAIGYRAVTDSLSVIKDRVHDSVPQCEITERRDAFRNKIPRMLIDEINIQGLTQTQADYVKEEMLRTNEVISLNTFKNRYFRLIAEDHIANVYPYILVNKKTGRFKAVLDITKQKPFKLDFGGYVSANAYTTVFLQFDYHLWTHQLIDLHLETYFGRYYNSVIASFRLTRLQSRPVEQIFSLGYSRWNYFSTYRVFVGSETPSYLVHEEMILDYKVSHLIKNNSRITGNLTFLGINDKYYWNNVYTQADSRDRNHVYLVRPNIMYEYKTTNFQYFPTRGFRAKAQLSYFAGFEINKPGTTAPQTESSTHFRNWFALNGEVEKIFRVAKVYRLGLSGNVAWSNLPMFESYNATKLRANYYAPTHESTMTYLPNYRDPAFMAVGLSNIFLLYKGLQFRLEGYYYQPVISILRDGTNRAYAGSLFEKRAFISYATLAYVTKLGPISVNLSWYSDNNPNLMFNISFGYLFFNNKIF
jgi:NTE family protein